MNPLAVLELLEQTPGKNDKVKILKQHKSDELSELLHATFDFKRKFHIKKFNAVRELTETELAHAGNMRTHQDLLEMLDLLQNRKITGNEAIQYVEWFFTSCSDAQIKWYARVMRKDLQAGFSESTANKAGYGIPKFEVMLAKDGKQCKKLPEIVAKGVFVSPKLDGYRCLAVCDGNDVVMYSRNGTVYNNFPGVREELEALTRLHGPFVMDGEIMSDTFNNMQRNAFASERRSQVGDVNFHVFGMIDFNEWETETFKQTTRVREVARNAFFSANVSSDSCIRYVSQHEVNSVDEILRLERKYMTDGYEGAMVLPGDLPYFKGKKSNKLMKFKTMLSMECEISGLTEGINKYEGMLGALNLIQENEVTCDCGSGFDDKQRKEFWNNPNSVIGKVIEVKYQELTPDGVMRFPIFMRFRDDKTI